MKVTLYSPDGKSMETIEAVNVIPLYSSSGYMCVVLEEDPFEKLQGLGPKKYFTTNLPMTIEKTVDESPAPPIGGDEFTVKLFNDKGEVIKTWFGAREPNLVNRTFGFFCDGRWIETTGYVMYEKEG